MKIPGVTGVTNSFSACTLGCNLEKFLFNRRLNRRNKLEHIRLIRPPNQTGVTGITISFSAMMDLDAGDKIIFDFPEFGGEVAGSFVVSSVPDGLPISS